MKRFILTVITLVLLPLISHSSPVVSLITCGATDQYVFYLYGHTAIRVQLDSGEDLAFNYGYFSPAQEHFIYNFAVGKPFYSLGVTPMEDFLYDYGAQGRYVVEQVLNLKEEEANALVEMLFWNAQPENRDYKYNFYFDNCATRPRDLIEEYTGGITYHVAEEGLPTFREAIRSKSYTAAWYTMGADLCLGWKSDQKMSLHDAAFLPELLMQEMSTATRNKDGEKLVLMTRELLPQTKIIGEGSSSPDTPFWVFLGIAALYALLSFVQLLWHQELPLKLLRSALYTVLVLGGIIIWFLALISEHPHTFPNAHMLLFHPFYIPLIIQLWKRDKKGLGGIALAFVVAIILFLALGYLQVYPLPITILAMIILVDCWRLWQERRKSTPKPQTAP